MNYCSIEDAWGNFNLPSQKIKEYMNNTNNINNINKTNDSNNDKLNNIDNCVKLLNHMKNCPKCYQEIREHFRPQIIEKFQNIIDNNKDIIVLFLIGFFIVLFLNLINNITSSK